MRPFLLAALMYSLSGMIRRDEPNIKTDFKAIADNAKKQNELSDRQTVSNLKKKKSLGKKKRKNRGRKR